MINKLRDTLYQVYENSGDDFSGLGLIVFEYTNSIPMVPLRANIPSLTQLGLIKTLVNISSLDSEFHDGFHLLSTDWKLTHISQYFSPPIVSNLQIDRSKRIGGRYMAALFGSKIQGIMLCGIISKDFGLAVFKNGKEVLFEEVK